MHWQYLCFSDCHDSTCAFLTVMTVLVLFWLSCSYRCMHYFIVLVFIWVCVKCFNINVHIYSTSCVFWIVKWILMVIMYSAMSLLFFLQGIALYKSYYSIFFVLFCLLTYCSKTLWWLSPLNSCKPYTCPLLDDSSVFRHLYHSKEESILILFDPFHPYKLYIYLTWSMTTIS